MRGDEGMRWIVALVRERAEKEARAAANMDARMERIQKALPGHSDPEFCLQVIADLRHNRGVHAYWAGEWESVAERLGK